MFKVTQTSKVRSDETASYSVKMTKCNVSLRDFIEYLLTEIKGEWGYVKIQKKGCPWYSSTFCVEYKWGKIISDNIPDDIKGKIVPSEFIADGGWSRMDYIIKLEELK